MRISRRWTTLVLLASLMPLQQAHAIPAWARKYNMNCDGCHYPAVPRLNAKGYAFKWAGYRMPDELGENQEVKQLSEYLAARFRFQYVYRKTSSKDADVNNFALSDATIFAGGPVGKWFGAFFEFEHAVGETELVNNVYSVWGKEKQYGGLRFGQMHWLLRGAVAGFDRPTGLSSPTVLGKLTAGGVPFAFTTDELGAEAFYVMNKNRLSVEVLNGQDPQGKGDETASPTTKDFAAIDQLIYDDAGSGLTAVGYFGAIPDLDPALPNTAHFTRFGISANKFLDAFEIQGGYVFGKDKDLPVGALFNNSTVTANGFWVYGGYTFPSSAFTGFARFESVNSNTDVSNSGNNRFVLGAVLPINVPEYFRLTAEVTHDAPKPSGAKTRNGATLEAMLNF